MNKLIEKIVDRFRKRKIFKLAAKIGLDVDGDIIVYKGQTYVIHILSDTLTRIKEYK